MKRIITVLLSLTILTVYLPALAETAGTVQRSPYLDAALSGLEEGNPFLTRYNELTGANVTPAYPTGIPYTFGGQKTEYLFKVMKITQISKYGMPGTKNVWGFDCVGYMRWMQDIVGDKHHPKISDMILKRSAYKAYRLEDLVLDIGHYTPSYFPKNGQKLTAEEIAERLEVGDMLAAKYGGRHILMYIGTLRQYGYTAETAPELADYLDYPLMISCYNDPNYKERMQRYIDENGLDARPNLGGVTVSIVGVPDAKAPHMRDDGAKEFYYFELGDYQLSVYDVTICTSYVFWRTIPEDRGVTLS